MAKEKEQIMKRRTKLLIFASVLFVFVAVNIIIRLMPGEKKAEISFVDFKSEDIVKINWSYEGKDYSLIKEGGKWYREDDKDFPVQQSYPENMAEEIAGAQATLVLKEYKNREEYGISETPFVTVTKKDSTGISLYLGMQNSVNEGYYLQVSGDNKIYMVSSSFPEKFSLKIEDMIQKEEIKSVAAPDLIRIDTGEKVLVLTSSEENGKISWYDGTVLLDTKKVNDIKYAIAGIEWLECVSYNASPEDLKAYGFDSPSAVFDLEGPEESVTIMVGNKTDGNYYAKLPDSKMVYTIDGDIEKCFLADSSSLLAGGDGGNQE